MSLAERRGRDGSRSRALGGLCFLRLLGLVLCGLAACLVIGVASASAYWPSAAEEAEASAHDESFSRQTAPFEETTEMCDKACVFGKIVLPPGWYLVRSGIGGRYTFRVHEAGAIECRNAETGEGCIDYDANQPEPSTEYLAPGYKEFVQTIELAYDVRDASFAELSFTYAWKPLESE